MLSEKYILRRIKEDDYNLGVIELLTQLTTIDKNQISHENFNNFIKKLNTKHQIWVIEDTTVSKIIAHGTLFIEEKLIHNLSRVGHIEDVVVDSEYRGQQLGKHIIDLLINISTLNGCYKTILDCDIKNVDFYVKCGMKQKGIAMAYYFK